MTIELRTYQKKCIQNVLGSPSKRQLISMPTGTGKTITFLAIAKELRGKKLILVHRHELLEQTYQKALLMGFKEEQVSRLSSGSLGEIRELNIAMVQTLSKNLHQYPPDLIDAIIVDEAHHALAPTYLNLFKHFELLEKNKYLIGFTATPLRGDGKSLGKIFDEHSFKMTLQEATQQGYICPVHGIRVDINYRIEEIESVGGDYDLKQLDKIVNCEEINELVALKSASVMRLPAVVFCTTVDHAEKIKNKLVGLGEKAATISYKNSKAECSEILRKLRAGEIDYILNAVKLTEGFDHPPIQTIIMARPTRSPSLYKQMIGRGLRLSPNKYDCLVMEFGGNDPAMICWDQIDSNCTFHSFSAQMKGDIKRAIQVYQSKFASPNIKVLDVRISPFSFYECKVQRMVKYRKDFLYIPHEDGFLLGEVRKHYTSSGDGGYQYGRKMKVYLLFWKEKYKSFTLDDAGPLWKASIAWSQSELEKQLKMYADKARCVNDENQPPVGCWYPSEEEPMSPYQRRILGNIKSNARKAAMRIEDIAIKKSIDKFWRLGRLPFMDLEYNDRGTVKYIFKIEE